MTQILHLPFSEYWLPLALGMVVGVAAVGASRLVSSRKANGANGHGASEEASDPASLTTSSLLSWRMPSEKRRSLRRDGNPTEVFLTSDRNKANAVRGWVVDRSLGGLCLSVGQELTPGIQLAILPVGAPEMTHWIDIEIKSCRPTGDGWEVGCSFVKTPPFSILLMLG